MLDAKEISSIAMNVLFVATFLCVFFFTYASKVEEDVIKNQVQFLVDDLSDDMQLLPSNILTSLKTKIATAKRPDMTDADNKVDASNKAIEKKTYTLAAVCLAVGLISIFVASYYWKFSFLELLGKNLVIVTFIGLTEFTFLMCFGRNFILADPNLVKLSVLQKFS